MSLWGRHGLGKHQQSDRRVGALQVCNDADACGGRGDGALSDETAFNKDDIKATLDRLRLLHQHKGQWIININPHLVDYWLARSGGDGVKVDPEKIHWMPYINSS